MSVQGPPFPSPIVFPQIHAYTFFLFLFEAHNRRIHMTTFKSGTTSSRSLVWVSAALLLLAGGRALAADRAGDPQAQGRELLSGTISGPTAATQSHSPPDRGDSVRSPDAQEQARQLVGTQSLTREAGRAASGYSGETSPRSVTGGTERRAHADAQEMARRIVLGTAV